MIKITTQLLDETSAKAKSAARRRMNYNFHKTYDETVQRMLNAAEPDTYIRPHKHEDPDKVETFLILRGRAVVVEFDAQGNITDHAILDRESGAAAVDLPPRTFHTFIALAPGTVLYEVKEGPYLAHTDRNSASWAPEEGAPEAQDFNKKVLRTLKIWQER